MDCLSFNSTSALTGEANLTCASGFNVVTKVVSLPGVVVLYHNDCQSVAGVGFVGSEDGSYT